MGGMIGGMIGAGQTQRGLDLAQDQQNKANEIIQNLANAPDAARPLILQQYRQAGILTPEMEATISAGPSAMESVTTNGKGIQAQEAALKQMQDRATSGMTATDRAALAQAQGQANVEGNAKQQQIMQQFAQRGQGGSGAQLAAQLAEQQGGANRASQNALDIMGKSQQQALQAAAQAGGMGSQLEGQQFGEASQRAQAADQMKRFNVQNQMGTQHSNVGAQNQAQGANLANLQNIGNQNTSMANQEAARARAGEQQNFTNQTGLAGMKAGQLQNYGNFQANAGAAGGKATAGAGAAMDKGIMSIVGMGFAEGGEIPPTDFTQGGHVNGQEVMPGDHPENDTVDAKLSPGEIVIPKSLAQTSLGDKLLDLLKHHHEIKTHLDGIEKKANKPKKQKFADGGMAMPPQQPMQPPMPMAPPQQSMGSPQEDAMQFGAVVQKLKSAHPNLSDEEIFKAAHSVQSRIAQAKMPPAPPQMPPQPLPVEPSLGEKIGRNMQKMARGYADGGPVLDPNLFAPGALERKPLAQYDDRAMNAMNTDSATGDKSPDSSGGLADMLAKFKSLNPMDKKEEQPAQDTQMAINPNALQPGLASIAGNKPTMPQMQAPPANFQMPGMSNGGAVPQRGTPEYLQHLMDQLHGKKNYALGTAGEDDGVVPETPDNLDEQNLEDYPDPVIDPSLAQGPSQQKDLALPDTSKQNLELPMEEETSKAPKSKLTQADEEIDKAVQAEEKASKAKPSEEDQMEKDLKPELDQEEEPKEQDVSEEAPKDESEGKEKFTNDELKELQRKRRMMMGLSGLAQAGAQFGGAVNRFDPSENIKSLQAGEKAFDMPIQDFKDRIANQQNDPGSSVSEASRMLYEKVTQQKANPNWSASDLAKVSPLFEKFAQSQAAGELKKQKQQDDLKFKYDKLQQDMELKLASAKDKKERDQIANDFKQQMLDVRKDMVKLSEGRLGASVTSKIEGEDIVKKANQRIKSADQAISQLEDKSQPLTMNRLNAIQIDLANTLNFMASQGASDYKAKSDKLENLNTMIAAAKQKYGTGLVDLRKQAPEVYKEVSHYAKSIKESTTKIRDDRYKELKGKYTTGIGEDSTVSSRINKAYGDKSSAHAPGDVVMVKGKKYRVGADGDSLEEVK